MSGSLRDKAGVRRGPLPQLVSEVSLSSQVTGQPSVSPPLGTQFSDPSPPAPDPKPLTPPSKKPGLWHQRRPSGFQILREIRRHESGVLWVDSRQDSPGFWGFMPAPKPGEDLGEGEGRGSPISGLPGSSPLCSYLLHIHSGLLGLGGEREGEVERSGVYLRCR